MFNISKNELQDVLKKYIELRLAEFDLDFSKLYHHIRCGIRSNIPFCCIIFFCSFWKFIFLLFNFSFVRKFINWYPPRKTYNYHYVACPLCVIMHRYRYLRVCNENDSWCCLRKTNE
jgi:hypothetical protein